MNIAIDIRSLSLLGRTGVGEYALELLRAIFLLDKENSYYLFYNGPENLTSLFLEQSNLQIVCTRIPNKLFNLSLLFLGHPYLEKYLSKRANSKIKIDTWFAPNVNFLSLKSETKLILTVHDLSFAIFSEFFSFSQRCWHKLINFKKQCERANIIITPSENTKRDIINLYKISPEKIRVIYPGVSYKIPTELEMSQVRKEYNLPKKYILFLGTFEPRKNILSTLKAFEIALPKLPPDVHLVLAGAGGWKNKAVYNFINTSLAKNRIKVLGYVKPDDKDALYRLSSLFVYPSFYEGFGFPVLEAMAQGVPVITSNRSSLPEITNGAAYLVNPNIPASLTQGMVEIINDEPLSKSYVAKGKQQVEKFIWQNAAKQWLKIIHS